MSRCSFLLLYSTLFHASLVLLPILGVTWILGFFVVGDSLYSQVVEWLFCIFTTLQGVMILVMHCIFNRAVRENSPALSPGPILWPLCSPVPTPLCSLAPGPSVALALPGPSAALSLRPSVALPWPLCSPVPTPLCSLAPGPSVALALPGPLCSPVPTPLCSLAPGPSVALPLAPLYP